MAIAKRFFLSSILGEQLPQIADGDSLHRQHRVLHAIQILSMNRWHELTRYQTKEDSWAEVVLAEPMAQLGVLGEGFG